MWNFAELSAWHVSSAPKHDEFFSLDNHSIAHSLVREMTQNSGDAAPPGKPATVRFRFGSIDSATFRSKYVAGLERHLVAISPELGELIRTDGPVPFLSVEDFGTSGLTGRYDDPLDKGHFNSFWKRYGQSQKGAAKGGRHGVGKSTAASASRIRTVFGVTLRHDDKELLLYGQAALKPHELDGVPKQFDSYGLFASTEPPAAPIPFKGAAAEAFIEDFGLRRTGHSGLSLVMPFPVDELTPDALIDAAVKHCFHQIVEGTLIVEVDAIALSSETILAVAQERKSLQGLLDAIALSQEVVNGDIPLLESSKDCRERLDASEFDVAAVAAQRERWLQGQTVGARIYVPIKVKGSKDTVLGEARVFIRRLDQPDPDRAREFYVRGRIMVPEKRLTQGKDCLALMVAADGPLSTFLGDSEPPSHTHWVQSKLKGEYVAPEYAFRRARYALLDLEHVVVGVKDGEAIKDLLKSFFFTPSEEPQGPSPGPPKPKPPAPTPAPIDFLISADPQPTKLLA